LRPLPAPRRGEIWLVDLDPIRGHEQAGRRPALVLSEDLYNGGPSDLIVVLALTTRLRGLPTQVTVSPSETGLASDSAILCDQIRTISKERLGRRVGTVSPSKLARVEEIVRVLLGL
jgi:mRNA interferase MazF